MLNNNTKMKSDLYFLIFVYQEVLIMFLLYSFKDYKTNIFYLKNY